MLTYTRTIKDGSAVEFKFIQNGDKNAINCVENRLFPDFEI